MNVYYADSIRAVWQSNSSNLFLLLATCSIQRGFQDWGWLVPDPRKSRSLDSQRFLRHFDPKKQLRCVCPGEKPNFRWFKRTTACAAEVELVPDVLELAELQLLLSKLSVRERTLALLDAATGLRVSELLALRWADVDFENLELLVTRSIWHQVVGRCKTEASAKPVPMDSYMAEDLLRWRRQSPYPMDSDYVFASPTMRGTQPYWPDNLMKRYIRPVAREAGINKNIGWHTFRHSFGTLLKANGEDVKTVQELLRHANSRITLDVYTQAVTSTKRAAQSKVVRMMVSDVGQKRDQKYPQTVQ
jgi:integrase